MTLLLDQWLEVDLLECLAELTLVVIYLVAELALVECLVAELTLVECLVAELTLVE